MTSTGGCRSPTPALPVLHMIYLHHPHSSPQQQVQTAPRKPLDHVQLFVGVLSRAGNSAARQLVRQTWGADPRLSRVMFFVLRPPSNTTLAQLRHEAGIHGDVVVTSEVDEAYDKITYSTLTMFRAAVAVAGVSHVLKTDDDCYVRVSLLLDALAGMPRSLLFAGFPWWHSTTAPHPQFGFGWGYVVSIDLARHIAAGAPHMVMRPDGLFHAEDEAVGMWVHFVAKDLNVSINFRGYQWNAQLMPTKHFACRNEHIVTSC